MHRNVRHITAIATVIAAMLTVGLSLGLMACSNDESQIRSALTTALDAFKNPTEQSLEPYFDASENETLSQLAASGVDIYDILGHLLSKFDYTIGDIAVDGDNATAEVTVSNIDLAKASQTLQDDLLSDQNFISQLIQKGAQGDATGIYALILEKLYAAIDNTTDIATANATLKLTKANGTWTVDRNSISDLVSKSFDGLNVDDLTQGNWT